MTKNARLTIQAQLLALMAAILAHGRHPWTRRGREVGQRFIVRQRKKLVA